MATSLEAKIVQGVIAYTPLSGLLGTPPRIYETQLPEGQGLPWPAIVVFLVSGNPVSTFYGDNPMSKYRVQFTIWEGATPDTSNAVLTALRAFLLQFSATTQPTPSSQMVAVRRGMYADTQPSIFLRIVDVMLWSNDQT